MSSRETLAQLATARTAAATISSFILTDSTGRKSKEIPCDLQLTHTGWDWALSLQLCLQAFSVMTSDVARTLPLYQHYDPVSLTLSSLPQTLSDLRESPFLLRIDAPVQEEWVPLCLFDCVLLSVLWLLTCLCESMCVVKVDTCRWCRAVTEWHSYICNYSYDLQRVQSGGCQQLITWERERERESIIENRELGGLCIMKSFAWCRSFGKHIFQPQHNKKHQTHDLLF